MSSVKADSDTPRTDALRNAPCPSELTFAEWHTYKYRALSCQLERENAKLSAEVEALRKDAERYRKLRESGALCASVTGRGIGLPIGGGTQSDGDKAALDAAIDAMKAKP